MSVKRRLLGAAASAAGVAAAGMAVGVARRRRVIARRGAGDASALGSLRSRPITVVADDGVPLHVEVDECEGSPLTVVFVHGYALSLDCWHFQRAAYRGLVRTVYYDQRSHGRSGRSTEGRATVEQLGRDLRRVLDDTSNGQPVVLVGHSMGGMSVIALAEQEPELFGDRVVGVALISTTAGGLDPHRLVLPLVPSRFGGSLALRAVAALAHGHRAIDGVRRLTKPLATVVTDQFAFGDEVPASYVEFVDEMLSATPFEVIAEFFPTFSSLDKFAAVRALAEVPVSIICGTADRLTSVGHSRKLRSQIPGARLLECEGAGHLVIMERHEHVNAELDQLLAAAGERVGQR
ncbi:MAG TPA: alpha/beta hydrolase [Nocardioides sp.]|nr:alpha/beta hydrolase [Nocardioides sp.]